MKFDDPEQEAPFWLTTNNAVLRTPFRGIQIKAYASEKYSSIGVFVSGPKAANVAAIKKYLKRERGSLLKELPDGTKIEIDGGWPIILNGLILNLTKRSECGL